MHKNYKIMFSPIEIWKSSVSTLLLTTLFIRICWEYVMFDWQKKNHALFHVPFDNQKFHILPEYN